MSSEEKQDVLQVVSKPGESEEATLARTMLRPTVLAGFSIKQLIGRCELQSLINELSDQVEAANEGDADRGVAILTAQAHTLDTIFHITLQKGLQQSCALPRDR